jgi:hypothetical protein
VDLELIEKMSDEQLGQVAISITKLIIAVRTYADGERGSKRGRGSRKHQKMILIIVLRC